jgi:crossover junction endodeoxyribonuclease RuvC
MAVIRILGIDPGLRRTGWGVIACEGAKLTHVAHGTIASSDGGELASRLREIHSGLTAIINTHEPDTIAVEETFVNVDARSTLKLGQARGVALLAAAEANVPIAEYAPNKVKKSVVGAGHAGKDQVGLMIGILLPGAKVDQADAADALAVAITHAHFYRAGQASQKGAA